MISNFFKNYFKNKFYIALIILIGLISSFLFQHNYKIHYKGSAQIQMGYIESKSFFVDEKILIYPLKGHNIFLMEKLFKDLQRGRIKINEECYSGSVFDDSNEFSVRRKQLGFIPGFDFKVSRTDFELTVEYRDIKNNVKECIESFIKGFTDYQNQLYTDHIDAQKLLFTNNNNSNIVFYDFLSNYAEKYNLHQFSKEKLTKEDIKKIEESGANLEIARMYYSMVQNFNKRELTTLFFKKTDVKVIKPISVEELSDKKLIIVLMINFISFIFTFIFVVIKEYDY